MDLHHRVLVRVTWLRPPGPGSSPSGQAKPVSFLTRPSAWRIAQLVVPWMIYSAPLALGLIALSLAGSWSEGGLPIAPAAMKVDEPSSGRLELACTEPDGSAGEEACRPVDHLDNGVIQVAGDRSK